MQLPGVIPADEHGREGGADHRAGGGGQAAALATDLRQQPSAHGRSVLHPLARRLCEGIYACNNPQIYLWLWIVTLTKAVLLIILLAHVVTVLQEQGPGPWPSVM